MYDRMYLINNLIKIFNVRNYLEIGVNNGDCFSKIECPNRYAVDPVDPKDKMVDETKKDGVKYYQMTSDDFFALKEDKPLFGLIFIDGLHKAEQVYRDISNSLELLTKDGYIIVHDCCPPDWKNAIRADTPEEAKTHILDDSGPTYWSGDVWKAIVQLRAEGWDDLHIFTLDTDTGLAVITKNPPEECIYPETRGIDDAVAKLSFTDLDQNRLMWLNLKHPSYIMWFVQWHKNRLKNLSEKE